MVPRISIHALRKESDGAVCIAPEDDEISIHALRKESDHTGSLRNGNPSDFNPRSP